MRLPIHQIRFIEPESNFSIGILDTITSMTNVATHFNAKISPNGSLSTVEGIGGTQQFASRRNGFLSFPDHANNGAGQHVVT